MVVPQYMYLCRVNAHGSIPGKSELWLLMFWHQRCKGFCKLYDDIASIGILRVTQHNVTMD